MNNMTDQNLMAGSPLAELAPQLGETPVAPAHGIAAIALNFAIKYHDIGTVQDGALYQQYKLEGRNLIPLDLAMVFETAIKMEMHLLGASERIAKVVVDALAFGAEQDGLPSEEAELEQPPEGAARP
jgi:hypothetical protein